MAAEILELARRLAWNRSGANLASGVASTLLPQRDAELGLLEVDEGALPEIVRRVRPRAVLLGNLFRDQLDRYGELEHIAERWRAATRRRCRRDACSSSTGTIRRSATSRRDRARRDRVRHRRPAARPAGAAARGRLDATASAADGPTSSLPPTSAISATTAVPTAATPVPRSQVRGA